VKDRSDKKEVSIQHCPTEEMLSDFYTKPQPGSLFHKMRAVLMGWAPLSSLRKIEKKISPSVAGLQSSPMKERVEVEEKTLIGSNGETRESNNIVRTYKDVVRMSSRNKTFPIMTDI